MPKRVENAARKAMEKGADELVAMMKRLVPVDDGDLRDSIGWTWGPPPKGSMALSRDRGPGDLVLTVYAGSDKAYYAAFVEFGVAEQAFGDRITSKSGRTRVSQRTTKGGGAQPFFFPSYRALEKRIRSRIKREMKKAIRFNGPPIQSEA
ncbi:HK97-gp10 family putative phage morphogenesis protein [Sinorhizobium meliloti]|uniref:HK97-gp10 family putative phage morphogenesis protein n=1 Tax=Rhizobium meliloti TaxID=382 RepID=UPI001F41E778